MRLHEGRDEDRKCEVKMKVRGHGIDSEVKIQVRGTVKECGVKVKVRRWLFMSAVGPNETDCDAIPSQ